ncbi:uncharacterized protein BDR25DRAFT_360462 [Lindgomyces ingoldianus]|uniref:Uncharacterized protein n=1 Tax=Lindgomyces ingoldianus TaxID=673940 RepID=A0ACB6QF43_9PLEO|nr:uncharacterized protein BDR25DRAFT_360462 [Lindgomyces ingoldianus]KAF2465512.1 hypothetical protein BDR25DRAFT_360462 [Lindgomyces ingoldianus]
MMAENMMLGLQRKTNWVGGKRSTGTPSTVKKTTTTPAFIRRVKNEWNHSLREVCPNEYQQSFPRSQLQNVSPSELGHHTHDKVRLQTRKEYLNHNLSFMIKSPKQISATSLEGSLGQRSTLTSSLASLYTDWYGLKIKEVDMCYLCLTKPDHPEELNTSMGWR